MEPLTAQEAEFAEEHHSLVFHFLSKRCLPKAEFYDPAVFGYLRGIKKWFARPDLRKKYKFTTIAWSCMRTDVGNFQKLARHRACHEAFSLDNLIPEMNGLTYADRIPASTLSVDDMVCIRETITEYFASRGLRHERPKRLGI